MRAGQRCVGLANVAVASDDSSVEELTFTVTRRQALRLLAYAFVLFMATVVLAMAWMVWGEGVAAPWAIGAGVGAVLCGYSAAAYRLAFTTCTTVGIRTRGLAGARRCVWADVTDIAARRGTSGQTMTIAVTTASGRRFLLGAPVNSPVMPDARFFDKYLQIVSYWQNATGHTVPAGPAPESLTFRLAHEAALESSRAAHAPAAGRNGLRTLPGSRGPYLQSMTWLGRLAAAGIAAVGVVLLYFGAVGVGPAWAAHLGHGTPGIFTATGAQQWQNCGESCQTATNWLGTVTTRQGSRADVQLQPDGAHITAVGQQEKVLLESDGWAYANGGGPDWLLTTLMVIGGAAIVGFSIIRVLRALGRTNSFKRKAAEAGLLDRRR